MRNYYTTFKNTCMLAAAMLVMGVNTNAAVFTAIASGNLSSSSTWSGGLIPGNLTSGDQIVIPGTFTVTQDQNIELTTGSSLSVDGTLMGGNGYYLDIDDGATLTGNGMIDIDSISSSSSNGFNFQGNISTNTFYSDNTTINSGGTITVKNTLYLASGMLTMANGTMQLSQNSEIVVEGGTLMAAGGTFGLGNKYDVRYTGSTSMAGGIELNSAGVEDVEIDLGSGNDLTLQNDMTVKGMLHVKSGALNLSNSNLLIGVNGDVMFDVGTGIKSSSNSDVTVSTNNDLSSSITFMAGANTVDDFTINLSNSSNEISIDGGMEVSGQLDLQNGVINIGGGTLDMASGSTVVGGSSTSYVATDASGRLAISVMANGSQTFHVGTSDNYAPAVITASSTSGSSKFSVGADGEVKEDGTTGAVVHNTQPMVANTWFIESSASSNIEVDVELMWSASMEVNSFDRTKAHVAHYMNSKWSADASASATTASNGMYSLTRAGVTSFSPFAVFDENTAVSVDDVDVNTTVAVYPNPVVNTLNISLTENTEVLNASIFNVAGQQVYNTNISGNNTSIDVSNLTNGMYYIQLKGEHTNATQKFIKQ